MAHVRKDRLAAGEAPAAHPQTLAGTMLLFGMRNATRQDSSHDGDDFNAVPDITHIVDMRHLGSFSDVEQLGVRFVSRKPLRAADRISVGRLSIYRQSR